MGFIVFIFGVALFLATVFLFPGVYPVATSFLVQQGYTASVAEGLVSEFVGIVIGLAFITPMVSWLNHQASMAAWHKSRQGMFEGFRKRLTNINASFKSISHDALLSAGTAPDRKRAALSVRKALRATVQEAASYERDVSIYAPHLTPAEISAFTDRLLEKVMLAGQKAEDLLEALSEEPDTEAGRPRPLYDRMIEPALIDDLKSIRQVYDGNRLDDLIANAHSLLGKALERAAKLDKKGRVLRAY